MIKRDSLTNRDNKVSHTKCDNQGHTTSLPLLSDIQHEVGTEVAADDRDDII